MDSLDYTVYNESDYLSTVGSKTDLTTTVLLQPASVVVVTVAPDGTTSIIPEHQLHSASSNITTSTHCQPVLEDTNSSSSNDKLVIVPLSSATGKRRRDWSKVNRKFHPEWTEQFAVVERDEKPLCLICQKVISQMKVSLIRAHYRKVHADFEARFTYNTDIRSLEISRLASLVPYSTMGSSSASFNRPNDDSLEEEDLDDEDDDFSSENQQTSSADDQQHQTLHLLDGNSLDLSDHFLEITQEASPLLTEPVQTQQQPEPSFFNQHQTSKRPRRDWNKVQRKFHHEWIEQYLVVEATQEQRPICLVCHRLINAMKVHNIRRHYLTLHATYFEHHFPTGSTSRKGEVTRLIENFRQNQAFVSILATPELGELEGEDEASDEFEESPVGSETQSREHQQTGTLAASTASYSMVPLNEQIQQASSSSVQHQPLPPSSNYQQTPLTIDKMEQAFTHLDRFLSIIEQNDVNVQRSFKVRTAIEVVVDCYKHLLKDMKSPGENHHLVADQSQQQNQTTSTMTTINNINNS